LQDNGEALNVPASKTVLLDDPVRDTSVPSTARSNSGQTRLTWIESAADAKAKTEEAAAEKAAKEMAHADDKDESSEEDDTSTDSDEDYQYSDSTISLDSDIPTPTRRSVEKASSPVSFDEQTAGTNVKAQEEEGAAMKREEDSAMGTTTEFMKRANAEDEEAYAEKVEVEALLAKNKTEEEKLKIVDEERKSREQEESNRNEDGDSLKRGRTLIEKRMPAATLLVADDALEKHLEHKMAERKEETDARKAAVERERAERARVRASDYPAEHALTEQTDATEIRQHASPDLNADKTQNWEDIDTNHAGKIDDWESKPQAVEITIFHVSREYYICKYVYIPCI